MSSQNEILKNKISIILNYFKNRNFNKVNEESEKLLRKNPNSDYLGNILGFGTILQVIAVEKLFQDRQ